MLRNLSVRRRLVLGFGSILLSLGALTGYASYSMHQQSKALETLASNVSNTKTDVTTWSQSIQRNLVRTEVLLLGSAGTLEPKIKQDMKDTSATIDALQKKIEINLDTASKPAFTAVGDARKSYISARKKAIELQQTGQPVDSLYASSVLPAVNNYMTAINNLVKAQTTRADTLVQSAQDHALLSIEILIGFGSLLILSGLSFALWVSKSIVSPLSQTQSTLALVAKGNLSVRVPLNGSDELTQLGSSLNSALSNLSQSVSKVSHVSDLVSSEMTTLSSSISQLGQRTQLQDQALSSSSHALQTLYHEAAQTTALGSAALSSSQQLRDLLVVSPPLSGQTPYGAHSNSSSLAMQDVNQQMTTFAQLNQQIRTIVSSIDDMARQTNILALNAGVEAARAGDAGRGFAVVATEVRALAAKSASDASTIRQILEQMNSQITTLSSSTKSAVQSTHDSSASALKLSSSISSLVSTINSQASLLSEVSSSFSQLERLTQENSSFVHSGSSTAHQLQQHVTTLSNGFTHFKTA